MEHFIIAVMLLAVIIRMSPSKQVFNRTRMGCSQLGANTRGDNSLFLHCHMLTEADNVECTQDNCPLLNRVKLQNVYDEAQKRT